MLKFTIVFSFLLSLHVRAADRQAPAWSVASLNGIVSYHDGANCFNAALAAKGYEDYLAMNDGIEVRYVLERFCALNEGHARPGDILTVLTAGTLDHAAVVIDRDHVFEKNSIAGLNGQFDDRADSAYAVKPRANSKFITECAAPDCQIQTYTCAEASEVRRQNARCSAFVSQSGITSLRRMLQEITLNGKSRFVLKGDAQSDFASITDVLAGLRGDEECALASLVSADSVTGHLLNLNRERSLGPGWEPALTAMRATLFRLRRRILDRDPSPETRRIFVEPSFIPDVL